MRMVYFADTSALCKRYVNESGSAWLRASVDAATGCQVIIVRTTSVEMIAAITRRQRGGSMSSADADTARRDFRADLASDYQVIEAAQTICELAMAVAEKHGLRGYDAIQLAALLEVNKLRTSLALAPVTLLSADGELNMAAMAEGIRIEDPRNHP